MAYVGNNLKVAYPRYEKIDDISASFNGVTTSFTLLVRGVAPSPLPLNSQQCLISVGGAIQKPDDAGTEGFRLSGGNIIFSSAPVAGESFFGVILAGSDYVNTGANFPDGSVSVPSITFSSDPDTGIYRSGSGGIALTSNGVNVGTFPSSAGSANQVLATDGVGTMSWSNPVPAGTVLWVAGSSAPAGYLKANGATISRSTYSSLFSAIGTTYGVGDGGTTFGIPDLRGEFVRSLDDGRGVDTGRTLGSAQAQDYQSHTHGVSDPGHAHGMFDQSGSGGSNGAGSRYVAVTIFSNATGAKGTDVAGTGISINANGGTETRPRNIALLAIIKF